MDENQVRSDLRSLAKKNQNISVLHRAIKQCEARMKYTGNRQIKEELETLKKRFEKATAAILLLENMYMECILRLNRELQTVVIDHYILCEPTWKIANKLSYSVSAVEKMYPKACRIIAKMLNEEAGK